MVLKTLLILLMLAIAKFLLIENVYWYYEKIGIAIGGTALFVVGSLLMSRIVTKKVLLSKIEIVEMAIVGAVSFICGISGIMNILSIIILAQIFPMMKDSKLQISQFVIKFFKWLGKYTLELYVVHLLCFYLLNVIFGIEGNGYLPLKGEMDRMKIKDDNKEKNSASC